MQRFDLCSLSINMRSLQARQLDLSVLRPRTKRRSLHPSSTFCPDVRLTILQGVTRHHLRRSRVGGCDQGSDLTGSGPVGRPSPRPILPMRVAPTCSRCRRSEGVSSVRQPARGSRATALATRHCAEGRRSASDWPPPFSREGAFPGRGVPAPVHWLGLDH